MLEIEVDEVCDVVDDVGFTIDAIKYESVGEIH